MLGRAKPWPRGNLKGQTRPVSEQMSLPVALVSDRMEETSVPPPSLPPRPRGKAIHLPRFIQDLPNPYNYLFFSSSGAPAATFAPSKVRGYGSTWEMPPKPISYFSQHPLQLVTGQVLFNGRWKPLPSGLAHKTLLSHLLRFLYLHLLAGQRILRWPQVP